MPVTVKPTAHPARRWKPSSYSSGVSSASDFLSQTSYNDFQNCKQLLRSSFEHSFGADSSSRTLLSASNGLVNTAFRAYSEHRHLTLRPEDFWLAVLSQFSFYVNAHAEELRSHFVAHEGQKDVKVTTFGTIQTVDFGELAVRMTSAMGEHIVDPELRQWVLPDFTTTTAADTATAAVLMMGTLQKYFKYTMCLLCSLPSVTLLGERDDWVKLQGRLGKLAGFGDEPRQFAALLEPVFGYLVRSFDEPESPAVVGFWSRIAHESGGSGPFYLSGWITAFCFWDGDGKCLYSPPQGEVDVEGWGRGVPGCDLDGTLFHRVDTEDVPAGYTSVPVTVNDNGTEYKTKMVAGSVGMQAWDSGDKEAEGEEGGLDSLQPASGWWMYEVRDETK